MLLDCALGLVGIATTQNINYRLMGIGNLNQVIKIMFVGLGYKALNLTVKGVPRQHQRDAA